VEEEEEAPSGWVKEEEYLESLGVKVEEEDDTPPAGWGKEEAYLKSLGIELEEAEEAEEEDAPPAWGKEEAYIKSLEKEDPKDSTVAVGSVRRSSNKHARGNTEDSAKLKEEAP